MVRALVTHQHGRGLNPGADAVCGLSFVVGSLPYSERFFSGYSGFPLSSKTNIFKFPFDQESGRRRTTLWMCYLQIIIIFLFKFECCYSGTLMSQRDNRLAKFVCLGIYHGFVISRLFFIYFIITCVN